MRKVLLLREKDIQLSLQSTHSLCEAARLRLSVVQVFIQLTEEGAFLKGRRS
jgi:hypothetical protein